MSIHADSPTIGPNQVELYSQYERTYGGLLLVLQGALLLAQGYVLSEVPLGRWWTPAGLLPLYLMYFAVRGSLWRRLYRPCGHLESARSIGSARLLGWMVPLGTSAALMLNWAQRPEMMAVPVGVGIGWSLGLWIVVVASGMLPVDYLFYAGHWLVLTTILRMEPLAVEAAAYRLGQFRGLGMMLMVWGFVQHTRFRAPRASAKEDGTSGVDP